MPVHWIDEAVQALAGVGVPAVGLHDQNIVVGQADQRDAGGLVVPGDVDGMAVEHRAVHAVRRQVDVAVSTR